MRSYNIRWSQEDKEALIQDVCEQIMANENLSVLNALYAAQYRILPKNKRKDELGGFSTWLNKTIVEDRIKQIKLEQPKEALKIIENNKNLSLETMIPSLLNLADNYITNKLETIIDGKLNKIINSTVTEYKQPDFTEIKQSEIKVNFDETKLIESIKEQLDEFLTKQEMLALKNKIAENNTKPDKKPMVLLINLLPDQFNEIEKDFGELFDLRKWSDGKDSYGTLKSLASKATKIYGMTDKMKHHVDKTISNVNLPNYVRFTGGMTTLKKLLSEQFCNS